MSGSLMSHNFKTIDFTVIFATNIFVPTISDNAFVSVIIHNTLIHNTLYRYTPTGHRLILPTRDTWAMMRKGASHMCLSQR